VPMCQFANWLLLALSCAQIGLLISCFFRVLLLRWLLKTIFVLLRGGGANKSLV
jgi:hypothetical protein